MRAIWALISIWAILFGQAHACQDVYVMADGRDCPTCPTSPAPAQAAPKFGENANSALSMASDDCRWCCKLTCRDEGGQKVVASFPSPDTMEMALPTAEIPVVTRPLTVRENVSVHARTQFPNAPPGDQDSRAPPASFA